MNEMIEKRAGLIKEARSMLDVAKTENRDLSVEERSKYDGLLAEVDKLQEMVNAEERQVRLDASIKEIPMVKEEKRNMENSFIELRSAMTEKRAITVNGTGAVNVVSEIVKAMLAKTKLADKYRYFYGANASTVVPILNPGLALPAGQNEGLTGHASDATAVLSAQSILPKAYVSVLPVSAEALLMSGSNLESQLPGIFADAFRQALYAGSLTGIGSGNAMTGMFLDAALTVNMPCAAAGTPKLFDLAKLALNVQDYMDDAYIVINPNLIAAMIAEATVESAPIKQELMTSRTVMGVPIHMTSVAPSTLTAGSVVAVAMSMSNYGVAIANELIIDPIKVKGDTNTYFQATMFLNGKVINPANGIQLVTV